eukprot:1199841-Alexandrium_andersonii.AAC.1
MPVEGVCRPAWGGQTRGVSVFAGRPTRCAERPLGGPLRASPCCPSPGGAGPALREEGREGEGGGEGCLLYTSDAADDM